MKHIEGNFKGVRDINIYYQGWLPDGEVKAVLLLVHGLGEHCGRYMNHVNYFVPLGYAIYALDHIGHGKSGGMRMMVDTFADLTDTLAIYDKMVRAWQPGKPVFLMGHSLGGLITCAYLLEHQADFKGAILSAPAIKKGSDISELTVFVGKILARVAPSVGVLSLDSRSLSHDPLVVKAADEDPLSFHGKTPARLAFEMLKTIERITAEVETFRLPFIVVQGGADRIVDPSGAQMLYDRSSSKDKTIKFYEGLFHEVHNEPEKELVFKDEEAWLAARI
jgi:alpha-beta hydrolase superfamily lysophospholipase